MRDSLLLLLVIGIASASPPWAGYYSAVDLNSTGSDLRGQLAKLLFKHKQTSYKGIWTAFHTLDEGIEGCSNETERGIYSAKCWKTTEQCGSYKKEGDCFNREHIWPKSWWGGFTKGKGAQTDLFELFPADGYVNNRRGNLPLGDVSDVIYTSSNGCRLGTCANSTTAGKCFEPPDAYKGQIARAYLYISTAYYNQFDCCETPGTKNGSEMAPWMLAVILDWHSRFNDHLAVEQRMNDEVQSLQGNRNPFIDMPELAFRIYSDTASVAIDSQ